MVIYSKNRVSAIPEIQGQVLQAARQRLKMKPEDLAAKACLSKKHITQLEEGGISTFYSESHKVTVAKKIGKLLNLEESQFLIYSEGDQVSQSSLAFDAESVDEPVKRHHVEASHVAPSNIPSVDEIKVTSQPAIEEKVTLENIQSGKRTANKVPLQIPRSAIKWGLLFLVVAGLLLTRNDIADVFFSKPTPVVVPIESVEALPDQSVPATSTAANVTNTATPTVAPPLPSELGCPKPDAAIAEYRVADATKAADFVFIQSKAKQTVCVTDALGKSNQQSMDVGTSYTFTGKAPFTVATNGLSQVAIYFQGRPVRIQGDAVRSIKLQEVKLSQ